MQPPLDPLQLITTDDDYHRMLPMKLSAAEAKILYAVLSRQIREKEEEDGQAHQMYAALLAKLYYYITDED
ncbi:hypothetical protein CLV84_4286 [Neolewinella xylanilytica]|uniref:Uncharacterized protein n=1 Tax=Neolewinella xylanilytica TaxID=1514080 RepID=A0A2S6HZZ7_9BACT|nr:hypothetical protein [Neolewinella xylanilytica]PPK83914.1 hypothetical protein CLV84_4286 [Neolewinella xylanilytica]